MTIDEFAALKVGDRITNGKGEIASVTAADDDGINYKWDAGGILTFRMLRYGTLFFQFDVVKPDESDVAAS